MPAIDEWLNINWNDLNDRGKDKVRKAYSDAGHKFEEEEYNNDDGSFAIHYTPGECQEEV